MIVESTAATFADHLSPRLGRFRTQVSLADARRQFPSVKFDGRRNYLIVGREVWLTETRCGRWWIKERIT